MIDLHLHLDGSLAPKTVRQMSEETGQPLPDNLENLLIYNSEKKSLTEYLKCFDLPLSFLQTPDNVRFAVMKLAENLTDDNVNYAEIRFAPQFHTQKGFSQEKIVLGALEALEYAKLLRVELNFILCLMRGFPESDNAETIDVALKYLGKGVCALDLAGDESRFSIDLYEDLFKHAAKLGIPFTIHAGEADGPESIWKSLRLGAKRIGHGIHASEDNELIKYLADHKIPLEMCPISNLQTGAVNSLEEYPLVKFMEHGVICTINTDNRTVSDTTIAKEFNTIKQLDGVTELTVLTLKHNAEMAKFKLL